MLFVLSQLAKATLLLLCLRMVGFLVNVWRYLLTIRKPMTHACAQRETKKD